MASGEESRKMAYSPQRTLPFMFVAMYYPGMLNNTNGVERIIRHHHMRPRSTQRLRDRLEKCGHPAERIRHMPLERVDARRHTGPQARF